MSELIVGIDEAGLGPVLGPFCLAAYTAERTFSQPILDSKKLHKSGHLTPLISACSIYCPSFSTENFKQQPVDGLTGAEEPWFLPKIIKTPEISSEGPKDKTHPPSNCIQHQSPDSQHAFWCKSVGVSEFNQQLDLKKNKADVTSHYLGQLVQTIFDQYPEKADFDFWIDRQGGRKYYSPLLESWGVTIGGCEESEQLSDYHGERKSKTGQQQRCRFRFLVKGDQQHHFIAAASCFAKLRREIAMERFNAWWKTKVPDLKPTAGYWVDGQRFINNIEFCREQLKLPTHSLIRAK